MNKILSTLVVVGVVVCMSASTTSLYVNATTTATTYPMNATSPTTVAPVNGTTPAAPFSCYQGYKVYVSRSGPLYQEVGTYAPCPPNDTQCDIAEYDNVLPTNATVFVQFGRCSNPMTATTCMGIQASNATQGRVKNCTVRVCTSSNCNAPPPVVSNQTCPHTPAGDVQVLPSCTLKQVLNKTFACMGPWFHGAPYADSTMCKSNLDTMTKCLSDVVVECLSGHCPSVLDAIPGARAFYPTIIHTAKKATSLRQALLLIPNITEPVIHLIENGICPTTLGIVDPNLQALLNINLNITLQQDVCDANILTDLTKWGIESAIAMQRATTHIELCSALNNIATRVITAWRTRCSPARLESLLRMVLPSNLQHLVPKITQAINIVVQYTENLSLPGCPAATAPICFNGTIVTSPNGTELSRTGGLVQCQAGATECGRVKVANRIHGNVVHWMNGFCSHPNHRPTCASIQALPSVQGTFDSCVLSYCSTHAGCNLPAPTNTLMCYNGTIVTHPDGRLISNTGGVMRCPAGYTECGSATVVNKIGEHVVHWVSGFCSHPRYRVTCQTLLQSPLVQGTFDSCRVNFCTSTDCNNPEGVPSCDRFYGGTSRCMQRRAWACDLVTWRIKFYTKWLQEFRTWKLQNMIPVEPLPVCSAIRPVGMCKDATKLVCKLDIYQCPVCYCSDHDYANLAQIEAMWRGDYEKWRSVRNMYNSINTGGSTSGGTC